ncbi:MAG: hypothetical protein NC191_09405, partial [Muribaculaceae bacterium]|nr:hypothetical protein [Muribaculaceae bacterium]
MQVVIRCGSKSKSFNDKSSITIGESEGNDFVVNGLGNSVLKMVYSPKYNNFVLVNASNDREILFNNKTFSKVLVTPNFTITSKVLAEPIEVNLQVEVPAGVGANDGGNGMVYGQTNAASSKDVFSGEIEKHRIAIVKEIGFKITDLKNSLKAQSRLTIFLYAAIFILSVVCSFGITNYLFGFKIDSSSSVLNLTTNPYILAGFTFAVLGVALSMKYGVFKFLDINKNKRLGENDAVAKAVVLISAVFMLVIYVINLLYYKTVPGFFATSVFISLMFVGALASVTVAAGYLEYQSKVDRMALTSCEYREDFENVMKQYRRLIDSYVNSLSVNRINVVKNSLLNCQLKAVVEMFVGLLTAPFLAYGVSNTLASCFPEAANWVRISGLRFSPVFLTLATFLIIFAFFTFVRGFVIGKQIKGSEIIKFDGFHDYNSHGVTVLGIDSMSALGREKMMVMSIASFIILIEFTMNVSYFITEIG